METSRFFLKFITVFLMTMNLHSQDTTFYSTDKIQLMVNDISDTVYSISKCRGCQHRVDVHVFQNRNLGLCAYSEFYLMVFLDLNSPNLETLIYYVDSLAKTPVYSNKLIASNIYGSILSYWSEQMELSPLQNSLLNKMINSDIDNCMRFITTYNINYLKINNITNEITEKLKKILINNKHTIEEAEIFIKNQEKNSSFYDTNGYTTKKAEFKKGESENIEFLEKVEGLINVAKEHHMELPDYIDSLQKSSDDYYYEHYLNTPINIRPILEFAGKYYMYELTKEIERIYKNRDTNQDPLLTNLSGLILARFKYKNYEKEIISRIMGDFNKIKENDGDVWDYETCFNSLCYINTNLSYSATYPFLNLVKKEYDDIYKIYIPYSYYFLSKLNERIINLPWDYNQQKLTLLNENKNDFDKVNVYSDWLYYNPPTDVVISTIANWLKNNSEEIIIAKRGN